MIEECLAVEFRVTGDACPLTAATEELGVAIDAEPPLLRRDGNALLRFSASASEELSAVLDEDDRIRYLHRTRAGDRNQYRCLSHAPCVVHDLTDAGFMTESLTYRGGVERHTGAVVGNDVLQGVMTAAGETVGVTIERLHPLGPTKEESAGQWDVTPLQADAITTALRLGYFEVPKGATAEEVATELGISKTAFLERLRRGQARVFRRMFGE